MKRVYFIIIILLFVLILFPKKIGRVYGHDNDNIIQETKKNCIGIEFVYLLPCCDRGAIICCLGIPYGEKRCYAHSKGQKVLVPECKEPQSWQQILSICPDCYDSAAFAAMKSGEIQKAKELCILDTKEVCFYRLALLAAKIANFSVAQELCSATKDKDHCYANIASIIFTGKETDIYGAIDTCKKIQNQTIRDECFYDTANSVKVFRYFQDAYYICDLINDTNFSMNCQDSVKRYASYN